MKKGTDSRCIIDLDATQRWIYTGKGMFYTPRFTVGTSLSLLTARVLLQFKREAVQI